MKLNRNDNCHCGSGKKYKTCCLVKDKQRFTQNIPAKTIASKKISNDRGLIGTLTGEITQPVRLCYTLYDKPAIQNKIFKNLQCMSYDATQDRWVWLFDHEAKNLAFEKGLHEIPKDLYPVIMGSFFSDNDNEMYLDLRSHTRAIQAITFFDQHIPREIAEVTDVFVLNRFVLQKDIDLLKNFDNFFKNVSVVNNATEMDERILKANDNAQFLVNFLHESGKKLVPSVEKFPTHYYEDGITSFRFSLQAAAFIALKYHEGKILTRNELIEIMMSKAKEKKLF
jgi:hypothetical protein